MCRWLAYTGSPILLTNVLYTPVHSLIDQSLYSKLGAETTNGDGFGIGWYDAAPAPGVFRSIEPAWNDQNLRELAGHVSSHLFFAHIRAAIGSPVQQTNCHPFRYGRWLWMHNGFIDGFAAIKRDLVLAVDQSLFPEIKRGDRHRGLVPPGAHVWPGRRRAGRGRARHRVRGGMRAAARRHLPVPGHYRHHRRRAPVGVSLFERGQIAVAVLQPRRPHGQTAISRTTCSAAAVRRRPVCGLGANRRSARRMGWAARSKLRGRRPRR